MSRLVLLLLLLLLENACVLIWIGVVAVRIVRVVAISVIISRTSPIISPATSTTAAAAVVATAIIWNRLVSACLPTHRLPLYLLRRDRDRDRDSNRKLLS